MSNLEAAQRKLSNTISVLQEQRNSALDALVTTTVELKGTMEQLELSRKKLNDLADNFENLTTSRLNLEEKIKSQNNKIDELEKLNSELQESLKSLKEKIVPKTSNSRKKV